VIDPLGWILGVVQDVDPITRSLLAALGMFCETTILVGLIIPGESFVVVARRGVTVRVE
jgi:membrane protein DedA with SNARE-associated domain